MCSLCIDISTDRNRGLDNAGKTTIILKFMGEDTTKICPTLGFNIKTLELEGYFRLDTAG